MSPAPTPLYTAEQIREGVSELAASLDAGFSSGDTPHLVAVLKGSFMFLADLVRAMRRPGTIDFVRVQSYGSGRVSSGTPRLLQSPGADLRDRHVVLVEDIVDTGLTLRMLQQQSARGAAAESEDGALGRIRPEDRRRRRPADGSPSAPGGCLRPLLPVRR